MSNISEILGILSRNRRDDILGKSACRDAESHFHEFLWKACLSGEKIVPEWILVSTGSDYTKPTATARVIRKPSPEHGEPSALVVYSSNPALEGAIVKEYSGENSPYRWARPKRHLFSGLEYPTNFIPTFYIPTVDSFIEVLSKLHQPISNNFVENITVFSQWLIISRPRLVDVIWEGYAVKHEKYVP